MHICTITFDFESKALSFCFQISFIWGLFALGYFWVGVRFKNFFRAYSQRSTLVLEVKFYLFFNTSVPLGVFLSFWALPGLFLKFRSDSNKWEGPTRIDYYLLFWRKALNFTFIIPPHLGLFCTFWTLIVDSWGWSMFKNFFMTSLHKTNSFVLEV